MIRKPSRAVAEAHAPTVIEKDDPVTKLFRKLNYFPTPPWAARAVAHRLRQLDPGARIVREPCCGEGHFAEPLREVFGSDNVIATDIYDYGYGGAHDFFGDTLMFDCDWIVTNQPFDKTFEFITRALQIARRGVIVAPCRFAMLETEGRQAMLYEGENPLTCMMPFVERVPMQLGSWDPNLSTATAYGAFVFHKGRAPMAPLPFKTGTKATYWRDDDPARFARPAPIPLFEKMAPAQMFASG